MISTHPLTKQQGGVTAPCCVPAAQQKPESIKETSEGSDLNAGLYKSDTDEYDVEPSLTEQHDWLCPRSQSSFLRFSDDLYDSLEVSGGPIIPFHAAASSEHAGLDNQSTTVCLWRRHAVQAKDTTFLGVDTLQN